MPLTQAEQGDRVRDRQLTPIDPHQRMAPCQLSVYHQLRRQHSLPPEREDSALALT